jgi:hypothetical protein
LAKQEHIPKFLKRPSKVLRFLSKVGAQAKVAKKAPEKSWRTLNLLVSYKEFDKAACWAKSRIHKDENWG